MFSNFKIFFFILLTVIFFSNVFYVYTQFDAYAVNESTM